MIKIPHTRMPSICARLAGLAALSISCTGLARESAPIPQVDFIEALAMDNAIESVDVSPDGRGLAILRRYQKDGHTVLSVHEVADLRKKPVLIGSLDVLQMRGINWLNNERLLVFFTQDSQLLQELTGTTRRASRIATIDRKGKKWVTLPRKRTDRRNRLQRNLGKFISASLLSELPHDKDHVLMAYSPSVGEVADIYKVNINNGSASLVARGSADKGAPSVDFKGQPRLATSFEWPYSITWARLDGDNKWIEIARQKADAAAVTAQFNPLGFFNAGNPNEILVASNHESNTIGIYSFDLEARKFGELKFRHPEFDASGVLAMQDRKTGLPEKILGYSYNGKGPSVFWVDPEEENLQSSLDAALPNRINRIVSSSDDRSVAVVRSYGDRQPSEWYLFKDRKSLDFIGSSLPFIHSGDLAATTWEYYDTRDGSRRIPALVTRPQQGDVPHPTVVMPHGGPVARDVWGFDPWVQLLAYHGYLVIQPQFRGSSGFGREHLEAGLGQWGYKMQDDIEDAAYYLIKRGEADPDRLAIFGWSYGGYSAFVGSYRDPNPFKCSIAGAGVSDLPQLRAEIRRGGAAADRIFSPGWDGDNPLDHVQSVDIPILVIHGTDDERVLISHSEKFVAKLRQYEKKHRYLPLEGANHFFGTIFYEHYMQMYPAMIDWLDNTCQLRSS